MLNEVKTEMVRMFQSMWKVKQLIYNIGAFLRCNSAKRATSHAQTHWKALKLKSEFSESHDINQF